MAGRELRTVLLVTPPYHCGMVESAGVWMPLGLAYLAGALRPAGYDPEIYDAMSLFHDMAQIRARLADRRPGRRRRDGVHGDGAGRPRRPAGGQRGVPRAPSRSLEACTRLTWPGRCSPTPLSIMSCAARASLRSRAARLPARRGDAGSVAGVSYRDDGVDRAHARPTASTHDLDALPVAWDLNRLADVPLPHQARLAARDHELGAGVYGGLLASARSRSSGSARGGRGAWRPWSPKRGCCASASASTPWRWPTSIRRVTASAGSGSSTGSSRRTSASNCWSRRVRTTSCATSDMVGKYRDAGILHVYVGVESVQQHRLDAMHKRLSVEDSAPRYRACSTRPTSSPRPRSCSGFPTTRRRRRGYAASRRSSTRRTSLLPGRARRGRTRTGTRRWPTASRSRTTRSTTSSTPSSVRTRCRGTSSAGLLSSGVHALLRRQDEHARAPAPNTNART